MTVAAASAARLSFQDWSKTEILPSTRAKAVYGCWMLFIDLLWSAQHAKVSLMVTPNCRASIKLISCNKADEYKAMRQKTESNGGLGSYLRDPF